MTVWVGECPHSVWERRNVYCCLTLLEQLKTKCWLYSACASFILLFRLLVISEYFCQCKVNVGQHPQIQHSEINPSSFKTKILLLSIRAVHGHNYLNQLLFLIDWFLFSLKNCARYSIQSPKAQGGMFTCLVNIYKEKFTEIWLEQRQRVKHALLSRVSLAVGK